MNAASGNAGEETDDLLSQAIAARSCGLYGKAINLLEEFVGTRSGNERRVYALLLLGILLSERFEEGKGLPYLEEAFVTLESDPAWSASLPPRLLCESYGIMAHSLLDPERPSWQKAEAYARKSLSNAGPDDSYLRYRALETLGEALEGGGKEREALAVRREAIAAAEASGYAHDALWALANSLLDQGELVEAKQIIIQAILSLPPPRDPSELAGILRSAAFIAHLAEDVPLVRDYLREAEHHLELDGDDPESGTENAVQIGRLALKYDENDVLLRVGRMLSKVEDAAVREEGMRFVVGALYEMGRNAEYISVCKKALADKELMAVDGRLGWWCAALAGRQCAAERYEACLRTCERGLAKGGNDESVEIALRKVAIFSGCKIGRRHAVKRHASIAAEQGMFAKDPELNEWLQENPDATRREGIVERVLRRLGLLR